MARAQQARPRQHRPDKAGQQQARRSRPDMQKPPRLCRKAAKRKPDARQTKQAKSKPEASQEQTGACIKRRARAQNKPGASKPEQSRSRPRAGQAKARNRRKVPKPPRLCTKTSPQQSRQSKPEAKQSRPSAGKKQAESPETTAPVHKSWPEEGGRQTLKQGQQGQQVQQVNLDPKPAIKTLE